MNNRDHLSLYLKYKEQYLNLQNLRFSGNPFAFIEDGLQNGGKKKNNKIYYIHCNGGSPFKIEIDKSNNNAHEVDVYVQDTKAVDREDYNKYDYEMSFNPKKIFIGKSPLNEMTKFSGGYGPKFDGNSILLELDNGIYEFIGESVYSFTPYGKIIEYSSPVGNNDVPYPWAMDQYGNIYLLVEDVVLLYTDELKKLIKKYGDPYTYYYTTFLITPDRSYSKPKMPLIPNFENIQEWYVGNEPSTFTYEPEPNKNYDRLTDNNKKAMFIKYNGDQKKTKLTKKMYRDLMKRFGNEIHVDKIKNKHVHLKRLF